MKRYIDTYYDLTCSVCAKSRSTDYEMGMETRKDILLKHAHSEGWQCIDKLLCPDCVRRKRERGSADAQTQPHSPLHSSPCALLLCGAGGDG